MTMSNSIAEYIMKNKYEWDNMLLRDKMPLQKKK